MRSYREILGFLLIRKQLLLAWKIFFFIVCGALFLGSAMLMSMKVRSVDLVGTVVSHGAVSSDEGHVSYLIVQLDQGGTVRARPIGFLDYRPGQRGVVGEVTTSFFGLKKYEFKGYLDSSRKE